MKRLTRDMQLKFQNINWEWDGGGGRGGWSVLLKMFDRNSKTSHCKTFCFLSIKEYRPSDKCDNSSLKMSWVTNDNSVHWCHGTASRCLVRYLTLRKIVLI